MVMFNIKLMSYLGYVYTLFSYSTSLLLKLSLSSALPVNKKVIISEHTLTIQARVSMRNIKVHYNSI